MTSKQRAYLRGLAAKEDTILQIGKDGITENTTAALSDALRARELVRRGADTIAFASCIKKGTPIGYACPFAAKMRAIVADEVGEDVEILDWTH